MANCYIPFSCRQQELEYALITIAEGANVIYAHFNLCNKWDGLTVYARFKHQAAVYDVPLDKTNCALIPWEVIRYTGFEVSVWGEDAEGGRLTSESVFVDVKRSINADGVAPLPATPSMIETFIAKAAAAEAAASKAAGNIAAASEAANAAAASAEAAAENAASALATAEDAAEAAAKNAVSINALDGQFMQLDVLTEQLVKSMSEIKEDLSGVNVPTKTSELENDSGFITGEAIGDFATIHEVIRTESGAININRVYDARFSKIQGGATSTPAGAGYGVALTLPWSSAIGETPKYAAQLFMPNGDDTEKPNSLFYRTSTSDAWNAWQEVATKADIQAYIDSAILGGAW